MIISMRVERDANETKKQKRKTRDKFQMPAKHEHIIEIKWQIVTNQLPVNHGP